MSVRPNLNRFRVFDKRQPVSVVLDLKCEDSIVVREFVNGLMGWGCR